MMIMTAGSRGDVDPFLALARRAHDDGHDVRVGVTRDVVADAEADGLDVTALDGDYAALVAAQGVSPWQAVRTYRSTVGPMLASIMASAARAAVDFRPDVIVHHPKVLTAPVAAARLDVPAVLVELVPTVTPTREFPAAGVLARDLGALNRATYRLPAAAGAAFAGVVAQARANLGVATRGPLPAPTRTLVPISPQILPRPADWPETVVVTGAWQRHPAAQADDDPELAAFLASGDVVYAGFGSMVTGDATGRGAAVVDAVRAAGRRVLVVTGWGGLDVPADRAGADVLVRRSVPHRTVLPRCVAAVHHAGAGTTHAVVGSGLPSVPVPFIADQPFWARTLHRRGLASGPVPARRLTAARLTAALAAVPERAAVRPFAERMATEDGTGTAMENIRTLR